LRHRRHARVEDRIRAAKDIAWIQRLALIEWAQKAAPKRLRLRLFSVARRLIRTAANTISTAAAV